MSIRITIMLDDDLVKTIRLIQSKLIKKRNENVSFSRVLNDLLRAELEKKKILSRNAFNDIPPRVEYSLTRQGKGLRNAIIPLLKWAIRKENSKMHCYCTLCK